MIAVQATEAEVAPLLNERVSIAAINGPQSVVISGDADEAERVVRSFKDRKSKRLAVSHAFHSPHMDGMLADFRKVAEGLTYESPRIAVVSNLTGMLVTDDMADPDFWVRHVREAVRFSEGVRTLEAAGVTTYLELGPDGILSAMAQDCLDHPDTTVLTPTLRGGRDEAETLTTALALAHVHGTVVDWTAYHSGTGARRVDLPTYAFQRERYWVDAFVESGDVTVAGIGDAGHPLLGAAVELPDSGGFLFTGRLSLRTHPWLADHVVADSVVVPGAAFVELAVRAGDEVGCDTVEELTVEAPLVLPETGAVQLRVAVGAADDAGRRTVQVHSRAESAADGAWSRNATGLLAVGAARTAAHTGADTTPWPPAGALEVPVGTLFERLAATDRHHGPAFRTPIRVWTRGEEAFAEARLSEELQPSAGRFGLHPALLDAVAQVTAVAEGAACRLPVVWRGVRLHTGGADALRLTLTPQGEGTVAVELADAEGEPLASVAALVTEELDAERFALAPTGGTDGLFRLDWQPSAVPADASAADPVVVGDPDRVLLDAFAGAGRELDGYADLAALETAVAAGRELPDTVYVPFLTAADASEHDLIGGVRAATHRALATVQAWLAGGRFAGSRLVLVTRGAVAAGPEAEVTDLAHAPVWGLVRAAQTENPDRFVLVDIDGTEASLRALTTAAASDEPELALRGAEFLAPRLVRQDAPAGTGRALDPEGTVLLTGASGGLARLFARHLAAEHGARHLLLVGRRGEEAEGARELVDDLRELGASATWAACDVADREAVAALLASVPAEHPLTAVVHTAAVLDDGLVDLLTPERVDAVLRPKAEAALHLHELTRELDLAAFVLFSAAAGTLGGAGQANYAAANVFLDALARHRHTAGLPALSLVWGMWAEERGMAGRLTERERTRAARGGVAPLDAAHGLALFDAALASDEPVLMPVAVDPATLRARAADGGILPMFRGLVRTPVRRTVSATARPGQDGTGEGTAKTMLAERLTALPAAERERTVLDLVRGQVAAVLGHRSAELVGGEQAFKELGFDSLTAVELRNRLNAASGLRLPATLVYDYPNPAALARHLLAEVDPKVPARELSLLAEIDRLESVFSSLDPGRPAEAGDDEALHASVAGRLQALLGRWNEARPTTEDDGANEIEDASDDELFALIDKKLGQS
ncbi:SDR family NAD(P)-dependent oxidoreductase [Streptomyces sp. NPDC005251]|uniref:SDR family NAD(P)-dependent oxidoreductase n=1 Tax=Streptomyces sp. NPDC005251 TaxID=3157166 RepID=UPI0033A7156C